MTGAPVTTAPTPGAGASPEADAPAASFADRLLGDLSAAVVVTLASLGDRLGLFKELADRGPATSTELADRAGVHERYAREWLWAMAAAGYLRHRPADDRFALPPEHAPMLAEENGPMFFGGFLQLFPAYVGVLGPLADAFANGGGVQPAAYPPDMWAGMERFTGTWYRNQLLPLWIPAMPIVEELLRAGGEVADVGCGAGTAIIELARAYPGASFSGFDLYGPSIDRARQAARAAGVSDRVHFQELDCAGGLPGRYDIVTAFDVVHDAADPYRLLTEIRRALQPAGRFVCLEVNAAETPAGNHGTLGSLLYSVSTLYCLTVSLAANGAGLGALGLPEATIRAMWHDAGFASVRRVPLDNPINSLYEAVP